MPTRKGTLVQYEESSTTEKVATIRPFEYLDELTGDTIKVSVSSQYSKLTVNYREYFFVKETGEFDGVATIVRRDGPIGL